MINHATPQRMDAYYLECNIAVAHVFRCMMQNSDLKFQKFITRHVSAWLLKITPRRTRTMALKFQQFPNQFNYPHPLIDQFVTWHIFDRQSENFVGISTSRLPGMKTEWKLAGNVFAFAIHCLKINVTWTHACWSGAFD